MGVGTFRTLGVQGAGVLGVIPPHRDNETQLCFLGWKCRMTGMGRRLCYAYHFATATNILRNCHCWPHQQHIKPCFDRTSSGYCLPPMGQILIWTRISENRNVSHPYDFLHNRRHGSLLSTSKSKMHATFNADNDLKTQSTPEQRPN